MKLNPLLTLGIIALFALSIAGCKDKIVCGDSICHQDETNCCSDCGCSGNQFCDRNTNVCKSSQCGDGVCIPTENCCYDCGCLDGQECKQNVCEKIVPEFTPPECGDGSCDLGEDEYSCCSDCPCSLEGMDCQDNACIMDVTEIMTDDDAKEIFDNYVTDENIDEEIIKEITYYDVIMEGITYKQICYVEDRDYVAGGCIQVNEEGEIVDEIHYI